jgi:hypothetical protein
VKEFALAHPWLTALVIVPVTVGGVVRFVQAVRGTPSDFESALEAERAKEEVERLKAERARHEAEMARLKQAAR